MYLKKITINNFKGITNFELNLNQVTTVRGRNGLGKTTIADAVMFCLYGKDYENGSTCQPKPRDLNSEFDKDVESIVELKFNEVVLKRVCSENWTKTRGTSELVFKGNEYKFFINDAPVKQSEFDNYVSYNFGGEMGKCIINPYYFNQLDTKQKRALLLPLSDEVNEIELLNKFPFLASLDASKSIQEHYNGAKYQVTELKKVCSTYDAVIKDNLSQIVDVDELGLTAKINNLKEEKQQLLNELASLDEIQEKQRLEANARFEMIRGLKRSLQEIQETELGDYHDKKRQYEKSLSDLHIDKNRLLSQIVSYNIEVNNRSELRDRLRKELSDVSAREFNAVNCSSCGKGLDEQELQSKIELFNTQKANEKASIQEKGVKAKEEQESLEKKLSELKTELTKVTESIQDLESNVPQLNPLRNVTPREIEIQNEINDLENHTYTALDNSETTNKIKAIDEQLSELNKSFALVEANKAKHAHVEKLRQDQIRDNQLLTDCERIIVEIERYNRAKLELLNESINNKFDYINVRMFKPLNNGGFEDVCEPTHNGVPIQEANTAKKINAGIDIANAFSKHLGIQLPLILDGKESIHDTIPTDLQVLFLKVDETAYSLTID